MKVNTKGISSPSRSNATVKLNEELNAQSPGVPNYISDAKPTEPSVHESQAQKSVHESTPVLPILIQL